MDMAHAFYSDHWKESVAALCYFPFGCD
jgi:hypothetical protein